MILFSIDQNGDYWLHPVLFAEKVLATIESEFATFESGHAAVNPFPIILDTSFGTGTTMPTSAPCWRDAFLLLPG